MDEPQSRFDPSEACAAGGERGLMPGEVKLARSIFGDAIDYAAVRIRRRKWFALQPRAVTMAPMGHLHFHPASRSYCDDFSRASLSLQGHFIHEMTHVWQVQTRGKFFLLTRRLPFCRYRYTLVPGQKLQAYGIEQQAEIVRHAFLMRRGVAIAGVSDARAYRALVDFPGATA